MKKILLIAFVFFSGGYLFSSDFFRLDLSTSFNIKNNFQKNSFTYNDFATQLSENTVLGGKIQNQFIQGSFYTKSDKITSGVLLSTHNLLAPFSVELKAGNLSFSGSISKLNNPLLPTSISPFSNAQTTVNLLQASLPGNSSFSKSAAYFLQINMNKKNNNFMNLKNGYVNFAYIQKDSQNYFSFSKDDTFVSSARFNFITKQKKSFSISTLGGFFTFEENIPSTWFSPSQLESYYPNQKYFSQNIQVAAEIKTFSTIISGFFYQNPFGNVNYAVKNENKYTLNNWVFNFSQFYSPTQILTSSEKIIAKTYQLKNTIQYSFCFPIDENLFFTKAALGFYFQNEDDEKKFKTAFGIQNQYKKYSGRMITTLSFREKETFFTKKIFLDSGKIQLNIYLPFEKIKNTVSASISFSPKNEENEESTNSEKIGLSMTIPNLNNLVFSNAVTFSQKNGQNVKKEISSSITEKINWKNVNYSVKISANFTF